MKQALPHLVETSVVRKMMVGPTAYSRSLHTEIGGENCFISAYIRMEIVRGFLCHLIAFRSLLAMPQIETFAEAYQIWLDRPQDRQIRAVGSILPHLQSDTHADPQAPEDKSKYLFALDNYILSRERWLHQTFRMLETNSTQCGRAAIPFKIDFQEVGASLQDYTKAFHHKRDCRTRCQIDRCLTQTFSEEIATYQHYTETHQPTTATRAFHNVIELLLQIQLQAQACTCDDCAKIGDAVIALETPVEMCLEHIDGSFDLLCDLIGKPHRRHLTPTQLIHNPPDRA